MKDLTQRKQLLVDACKKLDDEFIQVIRKAEEKNDMKLVIKGNALKRKSDRKQSQVGTLEESIKISDPLFFCSYCIFTFANDFLLVKFIAQILVSQIWWKRLMFW